MSFHIFTNNRTGIGHCFYNKQEQNIFTTPPPSNDSMTPLHYNDILNDEVPTLNTYYTTEIHTEITSPSFFFFFTTKIY